MIIKYSKKHLRFDSFIGSMYLIFGIAGFFFESHPVINYCFLLAGIIFLGFFYYKRKFQFLEIKDHVLTCYIPGSNKKIDLTELTRIKKFADEITFFTPYKKLKISTNIIAKEDLPKFEDLLASLDLQPEKNPFKKEITKTV